MNGSIPQRLRALILITGAATAAAVIGGANYGWGSIVDVLPILLAVVAGVYVVTGRDSDFGAVARRQADERQARQRMQVQALVGRVLGLAVAVAYLVAVATHAMLWPFGVLLGVLAVAFVAGWYHYGERGGGGHGHGGDVVS